MILGLRQLSKGMKCAVAKLKSNMSDETVRRKVFERGIFAAGDVKDQRAILDGTEALLSHPVQGAM